MYYNTHGIISLISASERLLCIHSAYLSELRLLPVLTHLILRHPCTRNIVRRYVAVLTTENVRVRRAELCLNLKDIYPYQISNRGHVSLSLW